MLEANVKLLGNHSPHTEKPVGTLEYSCSLYHLQFHTKGQGQS